MRKVSITSMQFRVSDPHRLWRDAMAAYAAAGNEKDGAIAFLGTIEAPNIKACIGELIAAGNPEAAFEIF